MRAPALQALGPRRGRVAVPLAGVVLVGWAGTLRLGTAMEVAGVLLLVFAAWKLVA